MRRIETLAADAGTLQAYLREIAKFPQLTIADERALGSRIRQRGEEAAVQTLVESNLRFVVSYAKRYRHLGVPFLDLIHEGNLGLIEAARRFDPERNVTFITCAVWWIRQSMMHRLAECARSQRVWIDRGSGEGIELADTLTDESAHTIESEATRDALVRELESAMGELNPHERQVMRLRYALHGGAPCTVQQAGQRLRLSRERIRQIESRAMQKLRRRKSLRIHLN